MAIDVHFAGGGGLPNVLVRQPLLRPEYCRVEYSGEMVTVHFGNVPVTMHYEDAIKLSQWIRVRAKEAKRAAGDVSRHWSCIAVIDDLLKR